MWYIECAWCQYASPLVWEYSQAWRLWDERNTPPGNAYVNGILDDD